MNNNPTPQTMAKWYLGYYERRLAASPNSEDYEFCKEVAMRWIALMNQEQIDMEEAVKLYGFFTSKANRNLGSGWHDMKEQYIGWFHNIHKNP